MYKPIKIFAKTLLWTTVGLIVVLVLSFLLLNTSLNKKLVASLVPDYLNAEVGYSKLRIHLLPEITLSIDSLVLKGLDKDTIVTADRISAGMKPFPLLHNQIRITDVSVDCLSANLWKDENGKANWDIVKESEEDTTETSSPMDLKIGHLQINGAVAYSTPSYVVLGQLDTIDLTGNEIGSYDALLGTIIDYTTPSMGTLTIPFSGNGRLGYKTDSASFTVVLDSLKTSVAYIPLLLDGTVVSKEEGYDLDLTAGVEECQLGPALDRYLSQFSPEIAKKVTAGTIALDAKVNGLYSDNTLPDVDASLKAEILGADIRLKGKVANLTDRKPKLEAHATVKASLDSFMRFVPADMDLKLWGPLKLTLDKPYSNDQRFSLTADFDTLSVKSGSELAANMKKMHNTVTVTYEKNAFGKRVPKLEVKTTNERVRLLVNGNRMSFKDLSLTGSIRKVKIDSAAVAKRFAHMPKRKMDTIPEFLQEKDFEKSDISVSVDSSITTFLSKWSPAGEIHLGRGSVVSPQFPLRIRITGIDGKFDSRQLDIDYAGLKTGRSDISVSGNLSGYGRMLRGKKSIIRLNLDAYSKRFNVNELMAAIEKGNNSDFVENGDLHDESFALDTLTDEQIQEPPIPLIVIPANLIANVNLNADSLKFAGLDVTPLEASFRVRGRTLQLLSSRLATSVGNLGMDAYYSTLTKQNISAGFHVDASKISAAGIISLLPSVDSIFPLLKSFDGNMNASLTATTQLDTNMNVIPSSLDAMFKIYGKDLYVDDAHDLRKVTRLLLFRNPNIGKIQDMTVGGVIRNSQIEIYPFVVGIDRYRLALSGTQGFDGNFDYHASILKSPIFIRFGVNIKGNSDNWKWRLCRARYKSSYAPVYSQRIDSMQINLANSIRNVFNHGADNISRAVKAQANSISKSCQADDSLQIKMENDSAAADAITEEMMETSFNEKSQERINSLREKIEQRAITRRSEVNFKRKKK